MKRINASQLAITNSENITGKHINKPEFFVFTRFPLKTKTFQASFFAEN